MNNKAYKNLIAFTFAFFVLATANSAFAAVTSDERVQPNYNAYNTYNAGYSQPYYVNMQNQNPVYSQVAPTYTQVAPAYQQPIQYVAAPASQIATAPTLQYVQSDVPTSYVNTPSSSSSTKATTRVASSNTVKSTNTSNVNQADTIPASNLGASAVNSTNNLTALSMNGTNSFMPDTVFEWFMTILCILIVIILVRVIGKKDGHGAHH